VPVHYVQGWDGGRKSAKKLVEVGLWHDETRDGIPGYRYHDWADFQRTRKAIEDEKRKAKDRMARIRSGNVRPNTPRTSDERSPNVHDSLTLTQSLTPGEGSRGEVPEGDANARERPLERCSRHLLEANPPPCGACADARRTLETWTQQ